MLDLRYCKVVFVGGGGAILLRRQIEESGKVGTPLFVIPAVLPYSLLRHP